MFMSDFISKITVRDLPLASQVVRDVSFDVLCNDISCRLDKRTGGVISGNVVINKTLKTD